MTLECREIQRRLLHSTTKRAKSITKRFSDLMFLCKVKAALKLLSNEGPSDLVTISEEVLSTLHEKHPAAQPMFEDLLLQGPVSKIYPATFLAIDGDLIQTDGLVNWVDVKLLFTPWLKYSKKTTLKQSCSWTQATPSTASIGL